MSTTFDEINRLTLQLHPSVFADESGRPNVTDSRRRRIIEVDAAGRERLMSADDPIATGKPVTVDSSNVHAVAFELNENRPDRSAMRIQYKQNDKQGRKTAGPTYKYHPVKPSMFRSLLRAGSKGSWIWDRLRVRGTVAGFRMPYTLVGIRQGHVPRRATTIGGQQWYIRRTKRQIQPNGRTVTHRSNLPSRRVGISRPNVTNPARRGNV